MQKYNKIKNDNKYNLYYKISKYIYIYKIISIYVIYVNNINKNYYKYYLHMSHRYQLEIRRVVGVGLLTIASRYSLLVIKQLRPLRFDLVNTLNLDIGLIS